VTTAAFTLLAVLLSLFAVAACLQLGRLDNQLGGDMFADSRTRLREWLGITGLYEHLNEQERTMAKVIDLLNSLVTQQQAASAAQATSFHNIDAAFARLQQAIADGEVSPEVQAATDQLAAGFASLQKAAEDEGRLYQPADANDQPADGGNTPDNGGNVPDQPQS